jgi:hypothetical protein
MGFYTWFLNIDFIFFFMTLYHKIELSPFMAYKNELGSSSCLTSKLDS